MAAAFSAARQLLLLAQVLPLEQWGWHLALVKAAAVPVIAFLVWLTIRGVRAAIESDDDV